MTQDLKLMIVLMIGTVAVILMVAGFVWGSGLLDKARQGRNRISATLIVGIIGGLFGIYGNISGFSFEGALISVRDIGPMFAGFLGGPVSGLTAGIIAGAHRLLLGGISAKACILATCIIGILCGLIGKSKIAGAIKPWQSFILGAMMELMHLGILMIMVKPFSAAVTIVKGIAVPFVAINAVGFTVMISFIYYLTRQTELNSKRNRLKSELSVAETIQKSMLPRFREDFPGRSEIKLSAFMEPARQVGGDFYDVFFIDDNKIAFLIADVSGKGIPAALFMVTAKHILKNYIKTIPDLGEAVSKANDSLCEGNKAEMFVTSWIGVLDLSDGNVEYVNCGHNPPVLLRDGHAVYLREKSGFVLAGMEGIKYKTMTIKLKKDDVLLLYTDGVTEAENSSGDLLGEDRLQKTIQTAASENKDLMDSITSDIKQHADGYEQSDDITLINLKILHDYSNDPFDGYKTAEAEAVIDNISLITESLDEEMQSSDIPLKMIYQFDIVIDEILSNVCNYSGAKKMTAGLKVTDGNILMRFANDGEKFDPNEIPDPDTTLSADERGIGGLGIYMVKSMMDDFEYEYTDGINIITVTKNL